MRRDAQSPAVVSGDPAVSRCDELDRAFARVQGLRNGRWITLITAHGHYGANGKTLVRLIYKGTGIIGMPTRVQFAMKSDLDHVGNHSRWMRFVITR